MHSNMLVNRARKGDREKGNEVCPFDLRVPSGFLPGCAAVFNPGPAKTRRAPSRFCRDARSMVI